MQCGRSRLEQLGSEMGASWCRRRCRCCRFAAPHCNKVLARLSQSLHDITIAIESSCVSMRVRSVKQGCSSNAWPPHALCMCPRSTCPPPMLLLHASWPVAAGSVSMPTFSDCNGMQCASNQQLRPCTGSHAGILPTHPLIHPPAAAALPARCPHLHRLLQLLQHALVIAASTLGAGRLVLRLQAGQQLAAASAGCSGRQAGLEHCWPTGSKPLLPRGGQRSPFIQCCPALIHGHSPPSTHPPPAARPAPQASPPGRQSAGTRSAARPAAVGRDEAGAGGC